MAGDYGWRGVAEEHDYERLFGESAPALWRAAYGFTGGRRQIAEDAVAEAFARAMERSATVRDPLPYIYRTVFRLTSAELRRDRRRADLPSDVAQRRGEPQPSDGERLLQPLQDRGRRPGMLGLQAPGPALGGPFGRLGIAAPAISLRATWTCSGEPFGVEGVLGDDAGTGYRSHGGPPLLNPPRLYHQVAGTGRRTALKFYGLRDNLATSDSALILRRVLGTRPADRHLKAADTRLGTMLTAWILLSTQRGSARGEMSCGLIAIGALELREAAQAWATEGAAPTYSPPYWKRSAFGYTGSAARSLPEL